MNTEKAYRMKGFTMKTNGSILHAFVRDHCSNWDTSTRACVGTTAGGLCLVMGGKRCTHFEKALLPLCDPSYRYATQTDKYQAIRDAYLCDRPKANKEARLCECGQPLKPRQRYCDKCRIKHRRTTYRQTRQKKAG